ncbi:MAG: rod shape-determining protein MreC [Syntrophobacterales bacterium]|jgi:rod shape-determining protein MreC
MNVRLRSRLRTPLLIAATLVFVLAVLSLSLKRAPVVQTAEGVIISLTAPVINGLNSLGDSLQRLWRGYFYLVGARKENAELKRQLNEYAQKEVRYQEALLLARRLEALLDLKKQIALPITGARVVAYDPSQWSRCVIVDTGKSEGITVGLPVLSGDGIVGRIVETYPHYAKVMLIVDRNSGADAMVQRTRVRGILQGKGGNRCSLEYVPKNADVEVGDLVLASGLGGIYPAGQVFGRVSHVDKRTHGPFQEIMVTPGNLSTLEEVLIVKTTEMALTP